MYVKTDNSDLQRLKVPEMDRIAKFSANNIARVPQHDGRVLIQMSGFSKHETE